ncbi:MAG TPA: helicase HerA-like domain-containing protein, partial [Paenirhodobacter sp.]
IVERTLIRPPQSRVGPLTVGERAALIAASPYGAKYGTVIDRESASEMLAARAASAAPQPPTPAQPQVRDFNNASRIEPIKADKPVRKAATNTSHSDSIVEVFGKSLARQLGSKAGQQIVRGVLGSLFRSR